jgi:tetratricopeptide (TPR) repeat protein
MRVGKYGLFGLFCFAIAMPASAASPLSRAQSEQYRQVGSRFGLTPEQVAQVYAFIDSQIAVIETAAREKHVNVVAFRSIARELGLRNYGADPQKLIEAIRSQAKDAAKFEAENVALRRQIATVEDPNIRRTAEAMLARADAAYEAGDLDHAQSAFEELLSLRRSELTGAGNALESATQAAISLAATRSDLNRLDRLVDEADMERKRRANHQQEVDRHSAWEDRMTQAGAYLARSVSSMRFVNGRTQGDNQALLRAISLCREKALPLAPREVSAEDWADTHTFLSGLLMMLGESESGTTHLREALVVDRKSLEVYTRERNPLKWAAIQNSTGWLLREIGERERATKELEESVGAHRAALEEYSRAGEPKSLTLRGLGYSLTDLGLLQIELGADEAGIERLKEAVEVHRAISDEQKRATEPMKWAEAQTNLGVALMKLGTWEGNLDRFRHAEAAFRSALEEQSTTPDWSYGSTQANLGEALSVIGLNENGNERLLEAVACYRSALRALGKRETGSGWPAKPMDVVVSAVKGERASIDWGKTQINLASALAIIAHRSGDKLALEEAWYLIGEAGNFVRQANTPLIPQSDNVERGIIQIAARHNWKLVDRDKPTT